MDTTNNAPVEADGATSAPDTANNVDTQPSQTEAGVSDTQSESEVKASEPLLAGKYKSPQELEKAYMEAQKKISEYGQKATVADLLQEKYGVTPEQLKERIAQQEAEQQRQYYANNPLAPVLDEVSQLRQVVERQEQEKALANEERQLDEFLKENPDYASHREKLKTLALTKGIGWDESGEKSYEDLAREWIGEIRAQGQNDAYQKIETKKLTQTTSPSTTKSQKGGYSSLQDLPRKERIKAFEQMMGG
jgi:hypothetical protein